MSDGVARAAAAIHDAESLVAGVVSRLADLPWPASAVVIAVGAVLLVAGSVHRRPVAAVGGAAAGAAAVLLLDHPLARSSGLSPTVVAALVAAALGAACGMLPALFPVVAGALPGLVVAGIVGPSDQRWLVLGCGAAAGGLVGVLLARQIAAGLAAAAGALGVAAGLAALLRATGATAVLSAHPVAVLGIAVVLAISGAAFQLPRAWGRAATPVPAARSPESPA